VSRSLVSSRSAAWVAWLRFRRGHSAAASSSVIWRRSMSVACAVKPSTSSAAPSSSKARGDSTPLAVRYSTLALLSARTTRLP